MRGLEDMEPVEAFENGLTAVSDAGTGMGMILIALAVVVCSMMIGEWVADVVDSIRQGRRRKRGRKR